MYINDIVWKWFKYKPEKFLISKYFTKMFLYKQLASEPFFFILQEKLNGDISIFQNNSGKGHEDWPVSTGQAQVLLYTSMYKSFVPANNSPKRYRRTDLQGICSPKRQPNPRRFLPASF